ncbi:MAG TPA: alpha-amylase family glycosyl hydrolase [Thermotogota bacterium]|nr:alpha-amylase family glycosyl hydrolase [Thermotogota bacterium]HRW34021.1 alpha-amylase family glycosyl hydrolase [Thermotogota bacterium]
MRMILNRLWNELYQDIIDEKALNAYRFEDFLFFLSQARQKYVPFFKESVQDWYKDAVVYSLYVDLFNKDIRGLIVKLDDLKSLGITCLWLLPILESPMKDAGFDISDYTKIRDSLTGCDGKIFDQFLYEAHQRGMRVIFDIALNHCSVEHPWFQEAVSDVHSPKRDYFLWSDSKDKYQQARIIFKGLCESNWEWEPKTSQYYFHRFFAIQPDLNYRNPQVLLEMSRILVNWKLRGLDGFRADAIPYIWKEEGTICENLPKTHTVVKFFRAALDYIEADTLLLAEACQPPKKVVEYFGEGDECNAAYHFPVMPRIYRSMAEQSNEAIQEALSPEFTPQNIPTNCQWMMFLRCHDELTLEMVTPEERKTVFDFYVKDPLWNFREGEGISARLATLLEENPDRIKLAYSIMFSLLGTPIIFYGDEFAKTNDMAFYKEQVALTQIKDSRYLVRGRIDWDETEKKMEGQNLTSDIYFFLKKMIAVRKSNQVLGRGSLNFLKIKSSDSKELKEVLAYTRTLKGFPDQTVNIIQNLSDRSIGFILPITRFTKQDLLGQTIQISGNSVILSPYGFLWI